MPPFPSPFAPIHMQTGHTNIGWDRAPPPLHPHPCVHMNGGAHRMGHTPPFTPHPHFCLKGAGKGTPTPLLPPPHHCSCTNRMQTWGCAGQAPPPLCLHPPLHKWGCTGWGMPPFHLPPPFLHKGGTGKVHPPLFCPPSTIIHVQTGHECGSMWDTPPPPFVPSCKRGWCRKGQPSVQGWAGVPCLCLRPVHQGPHANPEAAPLPLLCAKGACKPGTHIPTWMHPPCLCVGVTLNKGCGKEEGPHLHQHVKAATN